MELKPCVCGREAVVVEYKSDFGIHCKYSDPIVCVEEDEYFCRHLGAMDFPTRESAIEFWNTRPIEDALRAENKRIIKLFELLTPGGSEFYNDPDRCYRFAKDSHATMGKVAAERNALRARVAELEEAILTYIKQSGV